MASKRAVVKRPADLNPRQKQEVILERDVIKDEQRILVKEFIQGIVLGFLAGFLAAYLILG